MAASKELKDKIESIIITEINRIYEKAASPLGLTEEDIKKLAILVKIKDTEKDDSDPRPNPVEPKPPNLDTLLKIARGEDGK